MPDLKTSTGGLEEISPHSLDSSNPAEAIITDHLNQPSLSPAVRHSGLLHKALGKLKKDSGFVYIVQNAARHSNSPLEPLFRALYIEQPSFEIDTIDVVTDRNNVRKLLSFVNPTQSRYGLDSFTIQVDMTA
ncbi:unnamed protein product [Penicillium crustosum]